MTNQLFENLLFEEEGATIDFKKEQYRFVSATDDEKAELLKDILGFANAWRRTKAYILIGVEDVRGEKGNVVGIAASDQLDDHSLQQFVNSIINTPIHFQYRAFSYERKQVGIFVFDEGQERPVYLKRRYGTLEKEMVYVRRGSSTNPQKPASPEEIARMGAGRPPGGAELLVEFSQVDRDDAVGVHLHLQCELCAVPKLKDIPKLIDPNENPLGIRTDYLRSHNANYYRELAEYEFMTRLYRKVRLTVRNIGEVAANNVRVELVVPARVGLVPTLEMPRKPKREETVGDRRPVGIRSAHRRDPGEVEIDQNDDRYRIEMDCKDLQPGRQVWSDKFYIGVGQSADYPLQGLVFAANLPVPQQFTLTVTAEVIQTTLTVKELAARAFVT